MLSVVHAASCRQLSSGISLAADTPIHLSELIVTHQNQHTRPLQMVPGKATAVLQRVSKRTGASLKEFPWIPFPADKRGALFLGARAETAATDPVHD